MNEHDIQDICADLPALLTQKEFADILRVSVRTVRRWINRGVVRSIKADNRMGNICRIPRREVERILRESAA